MILLDFSSSMSVATSIGSTNRPHFRNFIQHRREVKNLGFRNLTEFTLGESSLCAVESVAANHALKGIGKIVS